MTLEQLLKMQIESKDINDKKVMVSPEFRVSVQDITKYNGVRCIIHVDGHDSETLDFIAVDDEIVILDGETNAT